MKKSILIAIAFVGCLSGSVFAQDKTPAKKDGQIEVNMEVVNGIKVLTVTTFKDGKGQAMRYTGEAAEKKLAELEGKKKEGETMEIKVVEVDGKKILTIEKTKDGVVTEEVYEGAEAEAKLKELEAAEQKPAGQVKMKQEKKVIEKSSM